MPQPLPSLTDIGTVAAVSPAATQQPQPSTDEPTFDYMPAGIDYGQAGALAGGATDVSGVAGMPPRAIARRLSAEDEAQARAESTRQKAGTDTSDAILESIRQNEQVRAERLKKLQSFDDELARQQQELMGNVPKQPTSMAMPDWRNQVGELIAGLARPGHMEAFTRTMLEQASEQQKAEFTNAVNAFQGRTQGIASQRQTVGRQIEDIGREQEQDFRTAEMVEGRRETARQHADTLEANTKYREEGLYNRAIALHDLEGIERHGKTLGLDQHDIAAEIERARQDLASDRAKKANAGIERLRKEFENVSNKSTGEIPEAYIADWHRRAASMATEYGIPVTDFGEPITVTTMKQREFAAKFPFVEEQARKNLVKTVVEVERARAAMQHEKAMEWQGNRSLNIKQARLDWQESKKKAGKDFEAAIGQQHVELAKAQSELDSANSGRPDRKKREAAEAKVEAIKAGIRELRIQQAATQQEPDDAPAQTPNPALPGQGKRPTRQAPTGPIGGGWGAPQKVSG